MNQQPLLVLADYANLEHTSRTSAAKQIMWSHVQRREENTNALVGRNRSRAACLGFHDPSGDGGLAVVTGLELQADGPGSDVGDG